jgi:hypothetical protein
MTLNAFHETNSANSYAWGQRLANAIELALFATSQVRRLSPADACAIAEAIIETGAGEDAHLDGASLYAGALDGSPLYRAAWGEMQTQRVRAQTPQMVQWKFIPAMPVQTGAE